MNARSGPSATFGREAKLSLASLVVIVGFLGAVVFHYWQGAYEGERYPHDTYLWRPSDTFHHVEHVGTRRHCFGDLLAACIHARGRAPYEAEIPSIDGSPRPFPSNYPPLGAMLVYPLTLVPYPTAIALFLAGSVAGLAWFGWSFFRCGKPSLDAIHVTALCLMAYPVHVVLDRANIEIVAFGMLAAATALLLERRCRAGAWCLGAAIATKIFPAVFLPLMARRCGPRGAATTLLAAGVLSLVSLSLMEPPLVESVRRLGEILFRFAGNMDDALNAASLSSGFYAPVAVLSWYAEVYPSLQPVASVLRMAYPGLAVACFAAVSWLTLAGRLRTWEAFTLATLCMVALPKASPDYRLIHLLIPFALFVHSRSSRREGIVVTLLFALLWVPKAWVWIAPEVSVGSILNPCCMAALAAVVVGQSLRRRAGRVAARG